MLSVTNFQELQKKEKNSDEESDSDEAFQETEWVDLSEPFPGKRKKKVKWHLERCASLIGMSTKKYNMHSLVK